MFCLAITLDAHRGESLIGYLHRLAYANALSGSDLIRILREVDAEIVQKWLAVQENADIWSGMIEELRSPGTRPLRLWSLRSHRYCSHCLHEDGYWHASWGLSLVTSCPRHGIALRESCPACEQQLSLEAMRDNCCTHCRSDIVDSGGSHRDAIAGELWVSREMERRLTSQNVARSHVAAHLPLAKFNELVLRLGVRGTPSGRRKPLKLEGATSLQVAAGVAAVAGQALQDWPNGFCQLIKRIQLARERPENWKIYQAIGPLYSDIFRRLKGAEFDFIRTEFAAYIRDHWEGPVAKRNRNLGDEVVEHHRWLSVKEASRVSTVDQALIQRLVDCGEVASRERRYQSGRILRTVDANDVLRFEPRLRSALTLSEAAKTLKLSESRVRQLIDGGVIVALGGSPDAGARWWIDLECIRQLGNTQRCLPSDTAKYVSIGHLAKHRIAGASEFVALIQAVRDGLIKVSCMADGMLGVGMWLLDTRTVESWLVALQPASANISVVDAARQLGVKQEVAYALVRSGLLPSTKAVGARKSAHLVSPLEISRFQKRYVMGRELAKCFQTSPKLLPKRLAMLGFTPAAGPNVSGAPCRQYVWRRTKRLSDRALRAAI